MNSKPFDFAAHLEDEGMVVPYLLEVLKEGDSVTFMSALGYAAEAHSRRGGTSALPENLSRELEMGESLRFETVVGILEFLGLQFTLRSIKKRVRFGRPWDSAINHL